MPPVLFVHGLWHGAWCWDEHFVPWFRQRGYDARAITLRRHDQRHAPGLRTTRIREYVDDVASAAAQMSEPPVVVGHSMGGFVTQLYLTDHPAPAAALIASIPPSGIFGATRRVALRHPLRFLASNATLSLYGMVRTPERAREMFFSPELPDADVARYQSQMTDDAFGVYVDMLFLVRPKVTAIKTPILVIGGDRDWTITSHDVEATAKAYHAEMAMFPGSHDLMLEPCWESVAQRIDTFVRSKAGAPTA